MTRGPLLRLRCPRCLEGAVFRSLFGLHENCPVCGLRFVREPGYWVGAMYFAYAQALALGAPLAAALWWAGVPVTWNAAAVGAWLVLWSPWIVRVSRVAWLHFDQRFDPR